MTSIGPQENNQALCTGCGQEPRHVTSGGRVHFRGLRCRRAYAAAWNRAHAKPRVQARVPARKTKRGRAFEVTEAMLAQTARYERCLAKGTHRPSGKWTVPRPIGEAQWAPLPVCACGVPILPRGRGRPAA